MTQAARAELTPEQSQFVRALPKRRARTGSKMGNLELGSC